MIYSDFNGIKLSRLGFGCMRFAMDPTTGTIDQEKVNAMFDLAIANGVNYFDTAYPYLGGNSEIAVAEALRKYPRDSYYLADKFPGHSLPGPVDNIALFNVSLRKCETDYFDFYLLHNVNENSLSCYYGNPDNHFIEYFLEQKAKGRIRHLGFSCHAAPAGLEQFLALYGKDVEFCQIQLNYVDWTLQNAKKKCEILKAAGLPVWVMEPVRGGRLAHFDAAIEEAMRAFRPDESIPAWAFRWLRTVPQPTMILSGMSNLQQMQDNLKTFEEHRPLNQEELALLGRVASQIAQLIPCTGCRYCCAGCPMELDIPTMLSMANDMAVAKSFNTVARYSALGEGKRADSCIGCGQCMAACPQKIHVPEELKKLDALMSSQKSWEEICQERAAAAEAMKKKG